MLLLLPFYFDLFVGLRGSLGWIGLDWIDWEVLIVFGRFEAASLRWMYFERECGLRWVRGVSADGNCGDETYLCERRSKCSESCVCVCV